MKELTIEERNLLQETITAKLEYDVASQKYDEKKEEVLELLSQRKVATLTYEDYIIEQKNRTTTSYNEEIAKPILKEKNLWEAVLGIDAKRMKKIISTGIIMAEQVQSFTICRMSAPYISIVNSKDRKSKKEDKNEQ